MGEYVYENELQAIDNPCVLSLNIQSLKPHHDHLNCFLNNFQKQPRLIALSETWLNENDNLGVYNLEGYKIVVESQTGKKGGGVAFLVKSEISFEKIQMPIAIYFEKTTIKTEKDNKTSFFTVIYRPPNKSFEKFFAEFEEFLQYTSNLKNHYI